MKTRPEPGRGQSQGGDRARDAALSPEPFLLLCRDAALGDAKFPLGSGSNGTRAGVGPSSIFIPGLVTGHMQGVLGTWEVAGSVQEKPGKIFGKSTEMVGFFKCIAFGLFWVHQGIIGQDKIHLKELLAALIVPELSISSFTFFLYIAEFCGYSHG